MLYRNLLTLVLVCSSSFVFGQNTILWKVTSPVNGTTSYLFGTYHIFGNSFVDSFPVIQEKLQTTDVVITEMKVDREKSASFYNARPATTELAKALKKEDVDYIATLFERAKVDIHKLSPGELFAMLQGSYPKLKCSILNKLERYQMDEYIQKLGAQENKELHYLESDSLQFETLFAATKKYDWGFFRKYVPSLLKQYRDAPMDKEDFCSSAIQYAAFAEDYKFSRECKEKDAVLLTDRNPVWINKLNSLFEQRSCFVAVGLNHLKYKCGLIEEMKKLGYVVEPVKMN